MNAVEIITSANTATLVNIVQQVAEIKKRLALLDSTDHGYLKEVLYQLCSLLCNCVVIINGVIVERSDYNCDQVPDVFQKLEVSQLEYISGLEVERQIKAGKLVIGAADDAKTRVSCIAYAARLWDTVCSSEVSPSVKWVSARQVFLVSTQYCTDVEVAKEAWACVRCGCQLNERNYCPAMDVYLNVNILMPVCESCHTVRQHSGVPTVRVARDPVCMCCFSVMTSYAEKYKYIMNRTPGVQRYVCDKCFALPVLCAQLAAGLTTSPEVLRENRDRLRDTTIRYVLELLEQCDDSDSALAIPIVTEIYSESKKYQNIVATRH